jgi:hypothetical protein
MFRRRKQAYVTNTISAAILLVIAWLGLKMFRKIYESKVARVKTDIGQQFEKMKQN